MIARQVIGNLKESALPYLLEQMRLAKLSFDLWGALSPTSTKSPPGVEQEAHEGDNKEEEKNGQSTPDQASTKRTISQAELESSLFKVIFLNINLLLNIESCITFCHDLTDWTCQIDVIVLPD